MWQSLIRQDYNDSKSQRVTTIYNHVIYLLIITDMRTSYYSYKEMA